MNHSITYFVHETQLNHILVIFQVSICVYILHREAIVGVRAKIDCFLLGILLLATCSALQHLLLRLEDGANDHCFIAVRVDLERRSPAAFLVPHIYMRFLSLLLCHVGRVNPEKMIEREAIL